MSRKRQNEVQKKQNMAEIERVTIWTLVDRRDGKKPRFERVTMW